MGEAEIVAYLMEKIDRAPILILLLWAELRLLPLVLDAVGWNKAMGVKSGVTEEEALAHRPKGFRAATARLFRRTKNGGPPPAAVALALVTFLILLR